MPAIFVVLLYLLYKQCCPTLPRHIALARSICNPERVHVGL